jgi:hypothetical protein
MKNYLLAVVLLLLVSCKKTEIAETDYYFDKAQPADDSELSRIPSKFRGVYRQGSSDFIINENSIYRTYKDKSALSKKEFDSLKNEGDYKDGRLTIKRTLQSYNVMKSRDSVYIITSFTDTIFKFSQTQKAKRINGYLVLSKRDSIFWNTTILSIKRDTLVWKSLSSKLDYVKLKPLVKVIEINADTTKVALKPSRKEFVKLLKIDGLGNDTKFKKVR